MNRLENLLGSLIILIKNPRYFLKIWWKISRDFLTNNMLWTNG
jgi:hypothetical protein